MESELEICSEIMNIDPVALVGICFKTMFQVANSAIVP